MLIKMRNPKGNANIMIEVSVTLVQKIVEMFTLKKSVILTVSGVFARTKMSAQKHIRKASVLTGKKEPAEKTWNVSIDILRMNMQL